MPRLFLMLLIVVGCSFSSKASHVMGGEITWKCQGGNYVFQLVFYRDCNGADVNTISENLRVWNHPTLTSITLPFVSRTDISPSCNQVVGSPIPLACGSGTSGGNGIGAIEKIVYQSAPIPVTGTPPVNGWVFTYENFSRSNALTNISNPGTYGITLAAKMYAIGTSSGTCVDNSPVFLQAPNFVTCAGSPYLYNMNAVDPDLDSLAIDFGIPYDNFPTGIYNPPTNPSPVPFEPGFSFSSPTPDASLNASNVAAQIDGSSGELTFTSFNVGNYAVKVSVKSYRNGILIAEVEREMQIVVTACTNANNSPIINAPFAGGLFETTVNAGTLVNFNLSSTDIELLQDGSPQSNLLSASGPMFGTNFTSTSGCGISPCATLNSTPIISGIQGVSATFNWQTDCDHLVGSNGNAQDVIPYHFVFRIQDDYCQVPKVSYATVTINVVNPGVIQAPAINCIHSDALGNVTIEWDPIANPSGTFIAYQIHSVQNGLLATLPAIGTNLWIDPLVAQENDYFIAVVSGCNGNTTRYSDTVSNIYLDLTNPANGTAILQWNDPSTAQQVNMNDFYYIYREYPTGTWTMIDSVAYGVNFYKDTIDICQAFLNYQIVLENQPCDFTSNVEGDDFEDMLTPSIPVISNVSIDTLTNNVSINWNQNNQPDTYGYVIYTFDANGFLYEMDTVWGISNTNYSYSPDVTVGPLSYSVAAFDSCYTPSVPPTFQTSAKADVNTTMFLSSNLLICSNEVELTWTDYVGWAGIDRYDIYGKIVGGQWSLLGTSTTTNFTADVLPLLDYCFFIKAYSTTEDSSFSQIACLSIIAPTQPDFHYLQVATVNGNQIDIKHLVDVNGGVTAIAIEKMKDTGIFEEIVQLPATSINLSYTDPDVDVNKFSYTYRARIIDSCGQAGAVSNSGTSILLKIQKDDVLIKNYLTWNEYTDFDGAILGYNLYRGIDGNFSGAPIAILPSSARYYEDDLNNVSFTGKVCYYVEAIEGSNLFNDPQISRSNNACEVFEPLIYIPNAFTPDGLNPNFVPVITNFDPTDYRFTVIDRWGQVVFQTDSPLEGWSGYMENTGKIAETGSYIYMVVMHDGNGIEIVKRGHVSLLK